MHPRGISSYQSTHFSTAMFKYLILVLLPTAILAKTLKPEKETYASYAARNGIPLAKSEASYQYADCYDYFGQQGYSRHITDYVSSTEYTSTFTILLW